MVYVATFKSEEEKEMPLFHSRQAGEIKLYQPDTPQESVCIQFKDEYGDNTFITIDLEVIGLINKLIRENNED